MEDPEKVAALEQQYIELLEQRIARLELQLSKDTPVENGHLSTTEKSKDEVNGKVADVTLHEETSTTSKVDEPAVDGTEPSLPEKSSKDSSRFKVVRLKLDPKTYDFVDEPIELEQKDVDVKTKEHEVVDIAFTYRKTRGKERLFLEDPEGLMSCEIDIHSKPLQRLLSRIVARHVGKRDIPQLSAGSTLFKALIWSWNEALEETKEVTGDKIEEVQARKDLSEMLKIISSQNSGVDHLQQYFKNKAQHEKQQTITFEHLWTLFPPGTPILGRPFMDEPQMFFVQSCDGWSATKEALLDNRPCKIKCYGLDWNGKEYSRVPYEVSIEHFKETRSIVELPYFPINQYATEERDPAKNVDSLKHKLIERGKRYCKLCMAEKGQQMFQYDGQAIKYQFGSGVLQPDGLDLESSFDPSETRQTERPISAVRNRVTVRGVVMVDFASYFEYQSSAKPFMGKLSRYLGDMECTCPECRSDHSLKKIHRPDWDNLPADHEFTDEQYLFCPPRVLGYSMMRKQWLQLNLQYLTPPKPANVEVFNEKLQMDEDLKKMIRTAVLSHETGKAKDRRGRSQGVEDLAEGKGKGLIILLYGLPGVGKTLTAESVAALAGKPLFSVGVSEIGIEGEKVEANLQRIFDLASLWEAVLLFDEADVFLESRGEGENDLRRNAMVSGKYCPPNSRSSLITASTVLLRVLEYYEGVLILTTNRLKSIDIAVQSRIHLAVKYDDLTKDQRKQIFFTFLEQLQSKGLCDLTKGRNTVREWVEKKGCQLEFNGRQIRNVVSTALGMTRIDENGKATTRPIEADDLNEVAIQTEKFQKELHAQEVLFRNKQMSRNS